MSMISEFVKKLRDKAFMQTSDGVYKLLDESADLIEELSLKLQNSQMERSSQYYHNGWIPCDERLPEPNVNVLICFYDGRRKKVSNYSDGRKKSIRIDKIINKYGEPAFWSKGNTPSVIAWMPLPQPYQPTTED